MQPNANPYAYSNIMRLFYGLTAWFLHVDFAVTACYVVGRLDVRAVGLAHCTLWESKRSLSLQPSARDTWDFPLQGIEIV